MKTKHLHHIVPKHMGGTNDKSNLILLTPRQHALAHKKLYEKYGKWQDKLAYQMLSGQLTNYQAQQMKRRLANLGNQHFKGHTHTKEVRKRISEGNMVAKLGNKYRLGKEHTEATKEKISESLKGNKNKIGKKGYTLSDEFKAKCRKRMKKNNPAKLPWVREKLRQAALNRYK